jgi:drug/metabolite transporter (DMT)-like permease
MSSEILAITYGISSAMTWGAGDFTGGYASKRTNVYAVLLFSQLTGFILLLLLALGLREPLPSATSWIVPGFAGIAGASGLIALYTGLASERMGIVAPMSAVIATILPMCIGMFTEGFPGHAKILGFVLAVGAVWLLTRTDRQEAIHLREVYLSVLAGGGFGIFFVLIGQLNGSAVIWPLVMARIASLSMYVVVVRLRRQSGELLISQLPLILLAGTLDAGGNTFFALATRVGRLDISAVLASLYPAATVLLARYLLKEQLRPQQWGGIIMALGALFLIA